MTPPGDGISGAGSHRQFFLLSNVFLTGHHSGILIIPIWFFGRKWCNRKWYAEKPGSNSWPGGMQEGVSANSSCLFAVDYLSPAGYVVGRVSPAGTAVHAFGISGRLVGPAPADGLPLPVLLGRVFGDEVADFHWMSGGRTARNAAHLLPGLSLVSGAEAAIVDAL